jgi:hypothetical protein
MKPTALLYDTRMDRVEIRDLLNRIPPRRRVEFLAWCCCQVKPLAGGQLPKPSRPTWEMAVAAERDDAASSALTMTIFVDLGMLAHQWDLDLDVATAKLVEVVRGRE